MFLPLPLCGYPAAFRQFAGLLTQAFLCLPLKLKLPCALESFHFLALHTRQLRLAAPACQLSFLFCLKSSGLLPQLTEVVFLMGFGFLLSLPCKGSGLCRSGPLGFHLRCDGGDRWRFRHHGRGLRGCGCWCHYRCWFFCAGDQRGFFPAGKPLRQGGRRGGECIACHRAGMIHIEVDAGGRNEAAGEA